MPLLVTVIGLSQILAKPMRVGKIGRAGGLADRRGAADRHDRHRLVCL